VKYRLRLFNGFVYEPQTADNSLKHLYVLDESSLSSTRNINKFSTDGSTRQGLARGDTRQHQAIEAGSPFEQLQLHGMQTAKLTEIVRQKNPELRMTVEKLAARQIRAAVSKLNSQGRIIEVSDEKERLLRIASDYVSRPQNTLVISPANKERVGINIMIHKELQKEGVVDPTDHLMTVLVAPSGFNRPRTNLCRSIFAETRISYDTTTVAKSLASRLENMAESCQADHKENLLTAAVERMDRKSPYDPRRLSGVTVYQEADRTFAVGDQIQFRAPLRDSKVSNGQLGPAR